MTYEFPLTAEVLLSFRGADAMTVELTHHPDGLVIWRPADTEVWATTPDGICNQIAGWRDNPCPGLDSGGAPLGVPARQMIEALFHRSPAAPEETAVRPPGSPLRRLQTWARNALARKS
jgi:hypothetical protein